MIEVMNAPATDDSLEPVPGAKSGKLRIEDLLPSVGFPKTLAAESHRRDIMADVVVRADCGITREEAESWLLPAPPEINLPPTFPAHQCREERLERERRARSTLPCRNMASMPLSWWTKSAASCFAPSISVAVSRHWLRRLWATSGPTHWPHAPPTRSWHRSPHGTHTCYRRNKKRLRTALELAEYGGAPTKRQPRQDRAQYRDHQAVKE